MLSSKTALATLTPMLSLALTCLWSGTASAANLLSTSTFDDSKGSWWGFPDSPDDPKANQTLELKDGKLCVSMTAAGEKPWDVGVGHSDVPVVAGKYYHISFEASSNVDRPIRYKVGQGEAPYADWFVQTAQLTTTVQKFEVTYKNLRDATAAQFQFQVGEHVGTICFDNIVLEEVPEPVAPAYTSPSKTGQPLKAYSRVVNMGTAIDTQIFLSNPLHNAIAAAEFTSVTPANSMKMKVIQPSRGKFNWEDTDALLAWAEQHGMGFRGHPLVWHQQIPDFIIDPNATFSKEDLIAILYEHIDALLERYGTRIAIWDVVNEAIEDFPGEGKFGYRQNFWYQRIGAEYIDLVFKRVREKAPNAKLFYNDYNDELVNAATSNQKGDRVYEFVKDLKMRGIPIDGVGFQCHFYQAYDGSVGDGPPDQASIKANMKRYADLNLEVNITEADFRVSIPMDDNKLQIQTKFYKDMLQTCIDSPNCTQFTLWGISDIDSWVPQTFPDVDFAHVWDRDFKPRPSYTALAEDFAPYNVDGTLIQNSAPTPSKKSKGCAVQTTDGSGAWSLATLLGVVGLAALRRKTARN